MNNFKRTAVIMAGGSGERFWPLSRKNKPKQLLKLSSGDISMLGEAINRINDIIPPEDIFIITGTHLLEPIRNTVPEIPPQNVIAEPLKRNTAPCLGLAAAFISEKYKEEGYTTDKISIAVLTADQDITPIEAFRETILNALNYVEQTPVLATIGIIPTRPETGYGYIETNQPFTLDSNSDIKEVTRFMEKPDIATANMFVASGNYLWNSGMFFWRLDTFISCMQKFMPEIGNFIPDICKRYSKKTNLPLPEALQTILPIFEEFPDTSIDYGLMEKADNVVVVRAKFKWDDIGSWDSLDRIRQTDENNNIISGKTAEFDMKNSIVMNESNRNDVVVSAFGLDNVVIVVTDDAVLVCPKDRVQEVKKSVKMIRSNYGEKYL